MLHPKFRLLLCYILLFLNMQIKHLKHNEIDFKLWDKTILSSQNQLIYAHSWFLNIVSPKWEALVTENYEYVMPLPIKRKYGVSYLTQPPYTQQLGVFSSNIIDSELLLLFVKKIPTFSYEININEQNPIDIALQQPNYILNLNSSYADLCKMYSKNAQRNLNKALSLNLKFSYKLSFDEFWEFNCSVTKKYGSWHPTTLKEIIVKGIENDSIRFCGVYNTDNLLIAALCLLITEERMTYLLPVSSQAGKSNWAMFLLIDELIKRFAGQKKILDFEGSRIEGIARFYKGFGAKLRPYYTLKRNKPTFLVDKLKQRK